MARVEGADTENTVAKPVVVRSMQVWAAGGVGGSGCGLLMYVLQARLCELQFAHTSAPHLTGAFFSYVCPPHPQPQHLFL